MKAQISCGWFVSRKECQEFIKNSPIKLKEDEEFKIIPQGMGYEVILTYGAKTS